MKSLNDWVELRYAETRMSKIHPNLSCKSGDDYSDSYKYTKKTVIEMKRFIQLREMYGRDEIKLQIWRVRVDRL